MKETGIITSPPIELHPLSPFTPENGKILFLGSFPPQEKRWSMEFFYPNFINDFWRIAGLLFFEDKEHFIIPGKKAFDKNSIVRFCEDKGIALYDTASVVRRLSGNASDKFLEIVTPTDITALLSSMPDCRHIAATGEKAASVLCERFGCDRPAIGSSTDITISQRQIKLFRMPSTSRAYPLPIDKKAEAYRMVYHSAGLL